MPLPLNSTQIDTNTLTNALNPWLLKIGDYTANLSDRILADTSAGSWVLNLPSLPSPGQEIDLFGVAGLTTHPLNINLNGAKFEGQIASSIKLNENRYVKLVYVNPSVGWTASTDLEEVNTSSPQLLLDKFPNAGVAYSLRKLRSQYAGFPLKVNNQDVVFENLANLANVLTSNVNTWYDQSENSLHALQTNTSFLPKLSKYNDKLSLSFENNFLTIPQVNLSKLVGSKGEVSIFAVLKTFAGNNPLIGNVRANDPTSTSVSNFGVFTPWSDGKVYFDIESESKGEVSTPLQFPEVSILSLLRDGTKVYINKNGQNVLTTNNSIDFTNNVRDVAIGNYYTDQLVSGLKGFVLELVIYNKFLPNYQDVEKELNSYYQVF